MTRTLPKAQHRNKKKKKKRLGKNCPTKIQSRNYGSSEAEKKGLKVFRLLGKVCNCVTDKKVAMPPFYAFLGKLFYQTKSLL